MARAQVRKAVIKWAVMSLTESFECKSRGKKKSVNELCISKPTVGSEIKFPLLAELKRKLSNQYRAKLVWCMVELGCFG